LTEEIKIINCRPKEDSPLSKILFEQFRGHKFAAVSLAVILLYVSVVCFIYAAEIFHLDTGIVKWDQTVGSEYEKPSMKNILGTDYLGRSVARKTLYGAKVSLTVAFFASVISMLTGTCLGALAGFFRGVLDDIIVWLNSTFASIPYILMITAFALVLKDKSVNLSSLGLGSIPVAGLPAACIAIGLTGWVSTCRLVRAEVIRQKGFEYVKTAKSYGFSNMRILLRHIMPNLSSLLIITFVLRFVYYIYAEVMLSFLGLGAKSQPSWGTMIDSARRDLTLPKAGWWEFASATAAIFFISFSINYFGDFLRDKLNPNTGVR
jgi:ABC-type dipeptide/oligopeptide/nickel transport system permease subunit